jgi:hypothetical protein
MRYILPMQKQQWTKFLTRIEPLLIAEIGTLDSYQIGGAYTSYIEV